MDETAHLERMHAEPLALLLELEQQCRRDRVPFIARETGRLLSTLVHAMQANRVLEIGTGYGYATLWMALALPPAGRIWTVDVDRENSTTAHEFFMRAAVRDAVETINQPPLEVLPSFPVRNLDIVFIHGEAETLDDCIEPALALLKRSGLLIVDAILDAAGDATARAFLRHPSLDATIVPVTGGLGIGAKL